MPIRQVVSPCNINRSVEVVWGKLYERKLLEGIRIKNVVIAECVEYNTRGYQQKQVKYR